MEELNYSALKNQRRIEMNSSKMIVLSAIAMYVSFCISCICLPVAIVATACNRWHAIYWIGTFFFSSVFSVVFYVSWDTWRWIKQMDNQEDHSPAMLERAGKV